MSINNYSKIPPKEESKSNGNNAHFGLYWADHTLWMELFTNRLIEYCEKK